MPSKPSRDTLIHCAACGEDYSATYRRCPFCGERNDPRRTPARGEAPPPPARGREEEEPDDGFVFSGQDAFDDAPEEEYYAPRPKGGKRLAPKSGGGFDLPPVNWPRLITFLCSLVIIVAALIIVFTFIYPKLHGKDPKPDASAGVSAAPSAPVNPTPDLPVTEQPTQPVDPETPPPTATPTVTQAVIVNASGLRVRSGPGTTYQVLDSVYNGKAISVLAPAENGWYNISYTKSDGSTVTGYIMGDYISTIAGSGSTATQPPATQPPATNPPVIATQAPSSGGPTVGRAGTIVNADGGLNVRPDPSRSNPAIASLLNGNTVQVVSDAGGGWYEITFVGSGGSTMRGYVMGKYISTN